MTKANDLALCPACGRNVGTRINKYYVVVYLAHKNATLYDDPRGELRADFAPGYAARVPNVSELTCPMSGQAVEKPE